jgi:hypothetical protein
VTTGKNRHFPGLAVHGQVVPRREVDWVKMLHPY